MLGALVTLLLAQDAAAVERAWKARAELATKKLEGKGLDECDRAVELAFQKFDTSSSREGTRYALVIRIGAETLLAGYSYDAGKLKDFSLFNVPPKWMVHQPTGTKTISVVLGSGPKCAFDLCSDDPFSEGPCKR